jgi:hypothetical protein
MRFQLKGDGNTIPHNSIVFACRAPPPTFQNIHNIPIERLAWTNVSAQYIGGDFGQVLNIDVNGTVNKKATDCFLVIGVDAVEDIGGVDFLGLHVGTHVVGMQDTVAPQIVDFEPKNGDVDQKLDLEVSFLFDDDINVGFDLRAVLYALGGSTEESFRNNASVPAELGTADKIVGVITFDENAFRLQSVTLNLGGLLEHDRLYTLALAPNSAKDLAGNSFAGLDFGTYVFRTATVVFKPPDGSSDAERSDSESTRIFTVVGVLLSLVSTASMVAFFLYYRVRRRAQVLGEIQQRSPSLPLTSPEMGGDLQVNTGTVVDAWSSKADPEQSKRPSGSESASRLQGRRPSEDSASKPQPATREWRSREGDLKPTKRSQSKESTSRLQGRRPSKDSANKPQPATREHVLDPNKRSSSKESTSGSQGRRPSKESANRQQTS